MRFLIALTLLTTPAAAGNFNYCEDDAVRAEFASAIADIHTAHRDPYQVQTLDAGQVVTWDQGGLRFQCLYRVRYTVGPPIWAVVTIAADLAHIAPVGPAN